MITRHNTNVLNKHALINVPISYHPLINYFRRKYSTDNNLQLQLSKDIRYVHDCLKAENLIPSITPFQLSCILQKIENCSYKVGPLEYLTCLDEDMNKLLEDILQEQMHSGLYVISPLKITSELSIDELYDLLPDNPEVQLCSTPDPRRLRIIMPSKKEDSLVFMGLSFHLLRLSYGCFLPEECYRLNDMFPTFLSCLKNIGRVDRLFYINLGKTMTSIQCIRILECVKSLVGNSYVYSLISSFLNIPIYDEDGSLYMEDRIGMPPMGELTRVLFNHYLKATFDREFKINYPGILSIHPGSLYSYQRCE